MCLVGASVFALIWWERGAPPGFLPTPHDVSIQDITRNHRGVRVEGTAHYGLRIVQTTAEVSWYLYPLFEPGDTMGREIKVLVRSTVQPEPLLGFEDLVIEGFARPPGRLIDASITTGLREYGYTFVDDYVLVEPFNN